MENKKCIFCKIINKEAPSNIIYEDEIICCFLDIDPINEGHVLIVPKKHQHNIHDIDDEVLLRIMKLSKKISKVLKKVYNCHGYTMMQNGGVFTDFGHFHMHIFPRYVDDGFGWTCKEVENINSPKIVRDILREKLDFV